MKKLSAVNSAVLLDSIGTNAPLVSIPAVEPSRAVTGWQAEILSVIKASFPNRFFSFKELLVAEDWIEAHPGVRSVVPIML